MFLLIFPEVPVQKMCCSRGIIYMRPSKMNPEYKGDIRMKYCT